MRVILLGSGTLHPDAARASAGIAVEAADRWLQLDLGRGVLGRMVQAGLSPLGLRHLLLTHLHPDHCCDLVPLLFGMNYGCEPARSEALEITGPVGTGAFLERLQAAWRWLEPSFPLRLRESEGGEAWEVGPARVVATAMDHGDEPALGYRLESEEGVVAYTGDTGPGDGLLSLASGVDILVSECALSDADARPEHLSPTALGELAAEAGCRRLVITHLYPGNDPGSLRATIRRHFRGELVLGHDGMVLEV